MLSKEEIEKAYWEGYIAKQNEAMEICRQCKYIKKVKKLESDKQKLIEKLEEDIKKDYHIEEIVGDEYITIGVSKYSVKKYVKEILSILKGENHE